MPRYGTSFKLIENDGVSNVLKLLTTITDFACSQYWKSPYRTDLRPWK